MYLKLCIIRYLYDNKFMIYKVNFYIYLRLDMVKKFFRCLFIILVINYYNYYNKKKKKKRNIWYKLIIVYYIINCICI